MSSLSFWLTIDSTNIVGSNLVSFLTTFRHFIQNLNIFQNPFAIIDISIVAALIYWFYIVIRETQAVRILYGILVLVIVFIISSTLNLITLNWLIRQFILMLIVAIPIVFQPELRRALEKLGQTRFFGQFKSVDEITSMTKEIIEATTRFAENKIGALIVLRQKIPLDEIIATGTKIGAQISADLLFNLFFPKAPLHDGAVIIGDGKILAAGCTLPLSEKKIPGIGLRHRAALGISEQSDAVTIVVSEERGTVSLVKNGNLFQNVSSEKLAKALISMARTSKEPWFFKRKRIRKN